MNRNLGCGDSKSRICRIDRSIDLRGGRDSSKLFYAAVIPGDSVTETVFVGGLSRFFDLYSNLLVGRVLLTWFPNLRFARPLQPLYAICDPLLGVVRNAVPTVMGVDLSPVVALLILETLTGASQVLGAEIPKDNHNLNLDHKK
uniref:YGGT family protein n=1 Tax=Timspurckia oligopyrenoides TaxID=708627 RepID=A0A7S0ZGD7_9RHOD|mmetsp:Transcript_418/g.765  ORF Transcript_418/g.765 Transcript_418/m.765 type:complete len:144 (+) Transcript_418:64-495(+)